MFKNMFVIIVDIRQKNRLKNKIYSANPTNTNYCNFFAILNQAYLD